VRKQGISGKNEQPAQPPWHAAPRSCIGCFGLRPALRVSNALLQFKIQIQ